MYSTHWMNCLATLLNEFTHTNTTHKAKGKLDTMIDAQEVKKIPTIYGI